MNNKGLFISFEGPDGSGKTSVIQAIEQKIIDSFPKVNLKLVREPGGTKIGEGIRNLLLNLGNEMKPITEVYLFAASRAELFHPESDAVKHLNSGNLLLVDRFVDSSIVYQGVHGVPKEDIKEINKFAIRDLRPNYTFFLMLSPEQAIERMNQRNKNRLDNISLDYQKKIYDSYRKLIENLSTNKLFKKTIPYEIDASPELNEVVESVWEKLKQIIEKHYSKK